MYDMLLWYVVYVMIVDGIVLLCVVLDCVWLGYIRLWWEVMV